MLQKKCCIAIVDMCDENVRTLHPQKQEVEECFSEAMGSVEAVQEE